MSSVHRILVVEDSEECAATIDIALGAIRGTETVVVDTAEDALQVLQSRGIALLITDIHLPGMSGLDLVAQVRHDARHADLPILVISGDAEFGMEQAARSVGATEFFAKP